MHRLLASILILSSFASATSYFVNPATGSDSNTGLTGHPWKTLNHASSVLGTTIQCGDTVNLTIANYILPTLQGGAPWVINNSVCPDNNRITWIVNGGSGTCTQAALTNCPAILGAINLGADGQWTHVVGVPAIFPKIVNDSVVDKLWVHPFTVATTQDFETIYWAHPSGNTRTALRKFRPVNNDKNNTTPAGDANVCFAGAAQSDGNLAAGCTSSGINGNTCVVKSAPCLKTDGTPTKWGPGGTDSPWFDFHSFEFRTTLGVPDINCSMHALNIAWPHILMIESWSTEEIPLSPTNCNVPAGTAHLVGPANTGATGSTGFIPGFNYLLVNAAEDLTKGHWYLDPCPNGCPGGVREAVENLYYDADVTTGEDPTTDDVWVPQQNTATPQVMVVSNSSGHTFQGFMVGMDNYIVPQVGGLRDVTGQPSITGAVEVANSQNITFEAFQSFHTSGWGMKLDNGTQTGLIQDSAVWDTGAGGIKLGIRGCPLAGTNQDGPCTVDTNTNVPSGVTIQNTIVSFYGRLHPSGEGNGIHQPNGHGILITHNDIFNGYCGGIDAGNMLNRDVNGPTQSTAGFMYGNEISFNRITGQVATGGGTLSFCTDMAGIRTAYNVSSLAPKTSGAPTGWPDPTVAAEFSNSIHDNWISDIATDPNNTTKHGGAGIYFEQGTAYMNAYNNLVVRISQDCVFSNVVGTSIPSPGVLQGQFLPQYNWFHNNICAFDGALPLAGRGRVLYFNGKGNNQNAIAFRHNMVLMNSTNAIGESFPGKKGQSHWGAFDYTQTVPGNFPLPATNLWQIDYNSYWDVSTNQPTFYLCGSTNTTCNGTGAFTDYTGIPWACDTGGCEDSHSVIADPHFLNPLYGTGENWTPTNSSLMSAIGFTPWDYTQAGRLANMIGNGGGAVFSVPNQANMFPQSLIQATSDYTPGFVFPNYTIQGIGTGSFIISSH